MFTGSNPVIDSKNKEIMKPCFEGLIGLSKTECECYEVPEELMSSSLGLYIDEHEGIDLQLIQNAVGCGQDLTIAYESINENAVNFFESDLQVGISENYKQKNKAFIGKIGETKFSAPIATSNYAGIKLKTKLIDGAAIIIDSVNLFFSNTGTITLQVYKNDEKLDDEYEIEIDSNRFNYKLPTPLKLPIAENGILNEYTFIYETGAMQPMNNKVSCGCQGVESVRSKFLTVKGVNGASFESLDIDNRNAYGLSLNAVISCSIDNLICDFMYDDVFKRKAAIALWYKMGVLFIERLFASREINFDTFTDREYLYTRKKKFESNYSNIIKWLSENSSITESNCFVCDSRKVMSMGKNLI